MFQTLKKKHIIFRKKKTLARSKNKATSLTLTYLSLSTLSFILFLLLESLSIMYSLRSLTKKKITPFDLQSKGHIILFPFDFYLSPSVCHFRLILLHLMAWNWESKPIWLCDAFLSFRGKDTRKGFISHLNSSLTNAGIRTYLDDSDDSDDKDDSLVRGDAMPDGLYQGIQDSRISIVVFSSNYGGSEWCLGELEKIMECRATIGQVVLPVFYDVDPSEIRQLRGRFGEAFNRLVRYTSNEKMWGWRRALNGAANLAGFHLKNFR